MSQIGIPPTKIKPIYPPETPVMLEVIEGLRPDVIRDLTGRPFFLSTLFIPEMLWTTRINDLDEVLDNFVKYKAGNSTRVFLLPSSWDAKYNRWATDIFSRDIDGNFLLPPPDKADKLMGYCINPFWEYQVIERIKKVVRRKIILIISLWDNCSFHRKSPGFWSENFLNPKNNRIDTSDDNHAYYKYLSIPTDNKAMLHIETSQNTGKIVEALTRYMLNTIYDNLTREERKYIAIETCNEGRSGEAWHLRIRDIIDEAWGEEMPRWRRFTSTKETSIRIRRHFTPIVHQIGNMDSYFREIWNGDDYVCGISTDGWHEPGDVPIPLAMAKRLLKRAYADGHVLMETLNGHRQTESIRLPGATHNTTPDKYFYDFSAMRWDDMKKLAKTLQRLTK